MQLRGHVRIIRPRLRARAWTVVQLFLIVLIVVSSTPNLTQAASTTLTFSPSTATVSTGATVALKVLINAGQAINAAEATITFPKDKLEVKSLSKTGSVFTLWPVEPSYSNANGAVSFAGGLPSPGFNRSGGTIITITFQAKTVGSARLTISGAQVAANDGQGTNVLSSTGSATITIQSEPVPPPPPPPQPTLRRPTISSTTHPDQAAWSSLRDVAASWTAGSGVRGYSLDFNQSSETVPDETSEGLTASFERTGLADGIWYLHVRAQYTAGWSATSHYPFRIDGTAPVPFTIAVEHAAPTDRTAVVRFEATDPTSGIDRYELKLDQGEFAPATSPVTFTDLLPGTHAVLVRAFDKAGNVQGADASFEVVGPEAPTVFFIADGARLVGGPGELPVILAGAPIRLRGYAQLTDRIRIIVRSTASVFEFPVEEIIDPNPTEPAPAGLTAWKVTISPELSPGEHEIHITALSPEGLESSEAPVIRFRVITDMIRIGPWLISYRLIIRALLIAIAVVGLLASYFLILWIRLRRSKKRPPRPPGLPIHPKK